MSIFEVHKIYFKSIQKGLYYLAEFRKPLQTETSLSSVSCINIKKAWLEV